MAKKKKKAAPARRNARTPARKGAQKAKRAAVAARATAARKTVSGMAKKSSPRKPAAGKAATGKAPTHGIAGKSATTKRKAKAPRRAGGAATRLERNKRLVLAMYQKLIGEKDFEAARPYLGATYRQHAPYAADGHEGVRAWLEAFKAAFPGHSYEVKKVLADGDMVVLHLHGKGGPNPYGESVVDFFRLDEDGKIIEHWDVIQAIPDTADNANSMF